MTSESTSPSTTAQPSNGLKVGLWVVQSLLALTFVGTAIWKVVTPIPELAAKMPWMGQVSPSFLYTTALLVALSLFVAWGRRSKAPIAPRTASR